MKVVGIVTEYNPFHLGHKYHLEYSKSMLDAQYAIAIMSGSFVQRGEPSIVDKWTKAKMAIDSGVDLVIELPFIFATQSAERFAFGAVALLNNLGIVDYISFGSELGDIKPLKEIANVLVKEPLFFRKKLKDYLDLGNSFPVSRSKALRDYYERLGSGKDTLDQLKEILDNPNNILAIEYLKSLEFLKSKIEPVTLKRIGSSYKENTIKEKISSATGIRNTLLSQGLGPVKDKLPQASFNHLINYTNNHNKFNTLGNYTQVIHYLLRMEDKSLLRKIIDMEEGLENRIINQAYKHRDLDLLLDAITSKRYTKTRIQRILIHLMLDLTEKAFHELLPHHPSYIRVLAANDKGVFLLRKIKESTDPAIITKFSHYHGYNRQYLDRIIEFDKKSTDLYYLGLDDYKVNMDYLTSPYIRG